MAMGNLWIKRFALSQAHQVLGPAAGLTYCEIGNCPNVQYCTMIQRVDSGIYDAATATVEGIRKWSTDDG